MNFQPDDDQRRILEAVEHLLGQFAGPARAAELDTQQAYDGELEAALGRAGFLEVARGPETGALEAALIVEAVARAAGRISAGASALVAPAVCERALEGPIALVDDSRPGREPVPVPVRYGAQARNALVLQGERALLQSVDPQRAEPQRGRYGYPIGVVALADEAGEPLVGGAERLRSWWRLALAVEANGCMQAALDQTVAYLKERRQFGRSIGSFQAVQHRLAECAVSVDGSRWLAYEAAARSAPREAAAVAAAFATRAAKQVFRETHQLSGAIGFTREHPLHVFSMRLCWLALELGGSAGHHQAVSAARWNSAGSH